ncbi:hypothetical protein GYMLUDRAFT_188807 [Collybiopsis luxurians FD-317 M1]|nr:hypothetical protein GYMLUDRAFT_188807 [Collybiopsis luxurians FD-317 M1]
MSSNSDIVFLTGATGFLGSHILVQLLGKGYRVRAAVREKKAAQFKANYAHYKDRVEVVVISDISEDKFPDALKGVKAVIHTAAPLVFRVKDAAGQIKAAVDGTMNVVGQAEKAGVTRIVVTSTLLTAQTPKYTFTDQDWLATTKEEALKTEGYVAYMAAKTLAEKEVWKFAESHPHVEITTLNPPYLYGPLAEGFILSTGDYAALSTNSHLWKLLSPQGVFPAHPLYIDIRDIAKAHILAIDSQPTSKVGRKRMIISSTHEVDYAEIVKTIREKRPELTDRLITSEYKPTIPFKRLPYNQKRLEEVIGMKPSDFTPLYDTILDSVDTIISVETKWTAEGVDVKVPL